MGKKKIFSVDLICNATVHFWDEIEAETVQEAKDKFKFMLDHAYEIAPRDQLAFDIAEWPVFGHDYDSTDSVTTIEVEEVERE